MLSQELEGKKAQQLGSLGKDRGTGEGIRKGATICSFWRQLLSSMKARYPLKEDLINY